MATLEPGRTLTTKEPVIDVDPTFKVGQHRFQLVVIREDRTASKPQVLTVPVVEGGIRRL